MVRLMAWPAILAVAACSQPFIMLPGGQLEGNLTQAPAAWASVPEVVQLEVRPSDPYSINIWALVDAGNLYVATEDADWVDFIAADSDVRIRIEDRLYELSAIRVRNSAELERVAAAYVRKYDYEMEDVSDVALSKAKVYRLAPRAADAASGGSNQ